MHIAAFVVCLSLLLYLYYRFCIREVQIETPQLLVYALFGISLNCLTSMSVVVMQFFESGTSIFHQTTEISLNLFRMAQIFVWLLFIRRLKVSFNGTKYKTSPFVYRVFYFLIFLFVTSSIIYSFIFALYKIVAVPVVSHLVFSINVQVSLWLQQWIDLTMSGGLLYLYWSKLRRLNMDIAMTDGAQLKQIERYSEKRREFSRSEPSSKRSSSRQTPRPSLVTAEENVSAEPLKLVVTFNRRQQQILRVMSKMTLLSALAIGATQFMALYLATYLELYLLGLIDDVREWAQWGAVMWAVTVIINSLCMFMSFDFADKMYISCCGTLHRCCFECCKSCVGHSIKNHVVRQTELGQPLLCLQESRDLL